MEPAQRGWWEEQLCLDSGNRTRAETQIPTHRMAPSRVRCRHSNLPRISSLMRLLGGPIIAYIVECVL